METTPNIRFSERMSQLPPYLFSMINKMKMERRWNGEDVIDLGLGRIKGYYDYGIFSPIQIAGIVAMRDCEDDIAVQAQLYQNRRDVMCEGLVRMGWPNNKGPRK